MTSLALWVLVSSALAASERSADRLAFTLAAFSSIVGALLLAVGDLERATLLAAILAATIVGASRVKYRHSASKLTVADLALVLAGTLPFLIVQYRWTMLALLAGGGASILAAVATVMLVEGPALPFWLRILIFAVAASSCAVTYRAGGEPHSFRWTRSERRCFFSTFMASLIDAPSWRPSRGLGMIDLATEAPLPLMPARPARRAVAPDIIIIQHELLFDPRLFGLAVEPGIARFLSPADGLCGALNVDIYGGGSWQSEFSVLTGLSSANFEPDAYFIFSKGIDRFHHTLPRALRALGYKTALTSSCRRRFLNYDAFYRSVGVEERIFSDDLMHPFDVSTFEKTNSDAIFLDAAIDVLAKRIAYDPTPRLTYALTNFNHGPHNRRMVPPGQFERERAFALASLPDPQYGEYYARLAETAATWRRLKARLASQFPDRAMLIVHYGDHQPVLTRRIERRLRLPDEERRQFRTFYAIETLNFEMDRSALPPAGVLDIAFLGTVALQTAGLRLDSVTATRASLIEECGGRYFLSRSDRKNRFHRTLVDLNLIDLGAVAGQGPVLPSIAVER